MKHLLLVLVIAPLLCFSQDIPKNANTIIVKGLSFDSVAVFLLNKGYRIQTRDKDLLTLKTEPKPLKQNSNIVMTIYARYKDSSMYFTANCDLNGLREFDKTNVENKGMKNSFLKQSFNSFNEVIKSLGKPVQYVIDSNL